MRFKDNALVSGPPFIKFYAGTPLISSANSHIYGTLCVIDTRPRHDIPTELYNLLIQFGELVVREIEKEKLSALQSWVRRRLSVGTASNRSSFSGDRDELQNSSKQPSADGKSKLGGLIRAADCFLEGVMLVDILTPRWTILYKNDTVLKLLQDNPGLNTGFWDIFSGPEKEALSPVDFREDIDSVEPFSLLARATSSFGDKTVYTIDLRPAAMTEQLHPTQPIVGIPSDVTPCAKAPLYYFAIVRAGMPKTRGTSTDGTAAIQEIEKHDGYGSFSTGSTMLPQGMIFKKSAPSAFTDVRLGPLIGRGAYGRVYRGTWHGNAVAVKVIEMDDDPTKPNSSGVKNPVFEAVLSSNLSHPNIAHTYQYAVRPLGLVGDLNCFGSLEFRSTKPSPGGDESRDTSDSIILRSNSEIPIERQTLTEVWLISEYCNKGPLLTAIERGAFLTRPCSAYGQPNLIAVLQTLQEIAAAMSYLHSQNILHGDLTGGNVLLTSCDKDARCFTAKVVDFGLSRVLSTECHRTRTMGCAEYMPPELIKEGILTKMADVYAFGVITWEMYLGRRAWEGLKPSEVLQKVAKREERLEFPQQTPHRLKILGEKCMEFDFTKRPTFSSILNEVNSILEDTMGILQQFLAASTGGG